MDSKTNTNTNTNQVIKTNDEFKPYEYRGVAIGRYKTGKFSFIALDISTQRNWCAGRCGLAELCAFIDRYLDGGECIVDCGRVVMVKGAK
jgi:hypothetical protein